MAWKAHQSKEKKFKTIKLSLIALGLLLIVILGGNAGSFILSLNEPVSENIRIKSTFDSWDKKTNLNIVIANNDESGKTLASLITLQPVESKAVALRLSEQIYVNAPLGFGNWTLGSVYKLGQEQEKPIGAKLLCLSIANLLGVPVDGLIITKNNQILNSPETLIAELRKNPILSFKLMQGVETNMSRLQLLSLFHNLGKVRSDKITSLDLSQSSITESKLLPDSSRVLGVDTIKLDYFVRENMADSVVVDEGVSIAIFNGTKYPGLASVASRTVTNIGGSVVSVATTDKNFKKSLVIVSPESKETKTYQRLTQIYAPECLETECNTDDPKITYSRAKINIILGEDYYELWNVR